MNRDEKNLSNDEYINNMKNKLQGESFSLYKQTVCRYVMFSLIQYFE